MFATEIRKMKKEDLVKEITDAKMELLKVQDQIASGKETEVRKSLKLMREIARMLTVLTQIEKEENGSGKRK
jgi:ribosomal protein L29